MAQGGGWGAGKIILAILGGLFLLGALCCGGIVLLTPDEVKQGVGQAFSFGSASVAFAQSAQNRLGKGYVGALQPDDEDGSMVVVLAVPPTDELTPERVRELQDIGWELYVESFASGGMPVKRLGIGTVKKSGGMGGAFVGWRNNQVTVEELVERTGLAAPPESEFFETMRKKQEEAERKREEEQQKELTPEEE